MSTLRHHLLLLTDTFAPGAECYRPAGSVHPAGDRSGREDVRVRRQHDPAQQKLRRFHYHEPGVCGTDRGMCVRKLLNTRLVGEMLKHITIFWYLLPGTSEAYHNIHAPLYLGASSPHRGEGGYTRPSSM